MNVSLCRSSGLGQRGRHRAANAALAALACMLFATVRASGDSADPPPSNPFCSSGASCSDFAGCPILAADNPVNRCASGLCTACGDVCCGYKCIHRYYGMPCNGTCITSALMASKYNYRCDGNSGWCVPKQPGS